MGVPITFDTIDILSNGLKNDVSWLEITKNSARPSLYPNSD